MSRQEPAFEEILGADSPQEYLQNEEKLKKFAHDAGASGTVGMRDARRFLEGVIASKPRSSGGPAKSMVPIPEKDPEIKAPPKPKGPSTKQLKEAENKLFKEVRNDPDVAKKYWEIQDLIKRANYARTKEDANAFIEKARQLSGEVYEAYEAEATKRKIRLGAWSNGGGSNVPRIEHDRVLDEFGYNRSHEILNGKYSRKEVEENTPFLQRKVKGVVERAEKRAGESAEEKAFRKQQRREKWVGRGSKVVSATATSSTWVSNQGSKIGGHFGKKAGPLGAFAATTRLLNKQARRVAIIGLLVGLLFVPIGFFTFSGWSIVAVAMVIVSAAYFVFLNIIKVIASTIVAGINLVFSFLAGLVVRIGEALMKLLGKQEVPCMTESGARTGQFSTFCNGHSVASEGLIPASELNAINISLLDPEKLKPTMSTKPFIQWFGEWTGLYNLKLDFLTRGLEASLGKFAESGNIYAVVFVFFVPTAIVAALVYFKLVRPALQESGVVGG